MLVGSSISGLRLTELLLVSQLDNYSGPELGELCRKYDLRNPDTDNEVGEPQQFNLMFQSSIGPTGQHKGYVWSPKNFPKSHTNYLFVLPQLLAARNCSRPLPQLQQASRVQQWPCAIRVCSNRPFLPQRNLTSCRSSTCTRVHYGGNRALCGS